MFVLHFYSVNSLNNAIRIKIVVGICFFKKLSILRRCTGNYMQCTGIFVTPTCYFGHLCSYFMQRMNHPWNLQVFVFYFCSAINLWLTTLHKSGTVILYNTFLYRSFDKIFMPLILQRYCKWTLFVEHNTFFKCINNLLSASHGITGCM
jgi:hypothetical protein